MRNNSREYIPKISIIIVNWNGLKKLGDVFINNIASVLSTDYPSYNVIIVDNNSSDNSLSLIKKIFLKDIKAGKLRIVELSKNYSLAGGNNIGAHFSDGDYLVFLNNDIIVTKDWLKRIINVLARLDNKKIALAQGKMLRLKDKKIIDGVGVMLNKRAQCYVRGFNEKDQGQYNKPSFIFGPEGAFYFIRKDVFLKLGGYDNSFFIYNEDDDLSWRAMLRGYYCIYIPTSVVYHLRSGSGYSPIIAYHDIKNLLMLSIKNHFKLKWIIYTFFEVLLRIQKQIRERKIKNASMQVYGIIWFFRNFKKIYMKRKENLSTATKEGKENILRLVESC